MTIRLYWFRRDLRLHDQPGLLHALTGASGLLPVYCHDACDTAPTPWGFAPAGPHRHRFLTATLADLRAQLRRRGSDLVEVHGRPADVLPQLAIAAGAHELHCEAIVQADAHAEVQALQDRGLTVHSRWFSSLIDPGQLPYGLADVPAQYTPFRLSVERAGVQPAPPQDAPDRLPPMPELPAMIAGSTPCGQAAQTIPWAGDPRSAFPYERPEFAGGETAALAHLQRYFAGSGPLAYKDTRNEVAGTAGSTKFSPWLAWGALSPRAVYAALRSFENRHGAGEGTRAIAAELLWRDFFRMLVLRAQARGLSLDEPAVTPLGPLPSAAFAQWCAGATGVPFVDAGMRELTATGFLSNRMRQVVASYLVNELAVPWQAGAAWFAAQLIDFDPYTNDGNWRYIAGTGADPRGGRHFNIDKQAREHDPQGLYRASWSVR